MVAVSNPRLISIVAINKSETIPLVIEFGGEFTSKLELENKLKKHVDMFSVR